MEMGHAGDQVERTIGPSRQWPPEVRTVLLVDQQRPAPEADRWSRQRDTGLIVVGYAIAAALCRPLTLPALAVVVLAGVPLAWYGIRRRPASSAPVPGRRSVAVWGGIAAVGVTAELALRLGPNDLTWPTLST